MPGKADWPGKSRAPLFDGEQDPDDASQSEWLWGDEEKHRPCAWIRKKKYKKRLERRFQKMHHHGHQMRLEGCIVDGTIFLENCRDDWRTHSSYNSYEGLYVSVRGDIRRFEGKIFSYCNTLRAISPIHRKVYTVQANRRIRHARNMEETCSSYSSLKKQYTYKRLHLLH